MPLCLPADHHGPAVDACPSQCYLPWTLDAFLRITGLAETLTRLVSAVGCQPTFYRLYYHRLPIAAVVYGGLWFLIPWFLDTFQFFHWFAILPSPGLVHSPHHAFLPLLRCHLCITYSNYSLSSRWTVSTHTAGAFWFWASLSFLLYPVRYTDAFWFFHNPGSRTCWQHTWFRLATSLYRVAPSRIVRLPVRAYRSGTHAACVPLFAYLSHHLPATSRLFSVKQAAFRCPAPPHTRISLRYCAAACYRRSLPLISNHRLPYRYLTTSPI